MKAEYVPSIRKPQTSVALLRAQSAALAPFLLLLSGLLLLLAIGYRA